MRTARIFKCGNSWAVRLPKDYQFHGNKVEIIKRKDEVILREIPENLVEAFNILTHMPDDFLSEGRVDTPPQERDF